ncbi:hypothetical protein [Streptomyces sp. NPDC058583]|uniref:hypothetical protein n=1 Tax=unclassified Streptomyces TaxID=2593676 RepID=UPI00364A78B2
MVNDNGTLRMVYTTNENEQLNGPQLWEAELRVKDGKASWHGIGRNAITGNSVAPALAVFGGKVHLLCVDLADGVFKHLVRDLPESEEGDTEPDDSLGAETPNWVPLMAPEGGRRLATPPLDADQLRREWSESGDGMRGNLALAAHDDKLHMVYNASGTLYHAMFDGSTWTDDGFSLPGDPFTHEGVTYPGSARSPRAAALASYDDKLHAVYPSDSNDRLRHSTWTQDGGWTMPVELKGHDSRNTPALLPFKEGPAGAEREALLLVHRGMDRYVPPPPPVPPAPPSLADVASRGTTVTGELEAGYGARGWSRLMHRFSLTPATLKNGEQGLIVTFEAWAQYYRLWSWHRENYGGDYVPHLRVDLYLREARRPGGVVGHAQFSESARSGYWRFEKLFTGLKPGDYEAGLFAANTEKTGGYWWNSPPPWRTRRSSGTASSTPASPASAAARPPSPSPTDRPRATTCQ